MGALESRIKALEQQRVHLASSALIINVFGCDSLTPEQLAELEKAEQSGQPCVVLGAASPPNFCSVPY